MLDRFMGCILGGALGDALGAPVEFHSRYSIRNIYGPDGILEPPDPALYTDDTQLTLRVLRGLIKAPPGRPSLEIKKAVQDQLVLWLDEDEPRCPGRACCLGAANIKAGIIPSGAPDSKGCGAVMRSAPYGMLFPSPIDAMDYAQDHSELTHLHPDSQSASGTFAYIIWRLIHNKGGVDFELMTEIIKSARRVVRPMHRLATLGGALAGTDVSPHIVLDNWLGWVADEALGAAVFCFMRHLRWPVRDPPNPAMFRAVVRMAANTSGDSDSVAAIAGNLVGAAFGRSVLPDEWLERLEGKDEIVRLCAEASEVI